MPALERRNAGRCNELGVLDAAGNLMIVRDEEVGKDQQRIYGLRWTG